MNILYLYNETQTYTNAVYEHISSFANYSSHCSFFCHQDQLTELHIDSRRFDAVGIHFSIRLPYDQLSASTIKFLKEYTGLKFLFIQDEYDHTQKTWSWINTLGVQLVFTTVPEAGIEQIYPKDKFPNTKFVNNLTGYVPDKLQLFHDVLPPSQRPILIGYRARVLPVKYGQLGFDKVNIGKIVKSFCDEHGINNDINWTEESRIYGEDWYKFMMSCRAMLGSESGSNVFDWEGSLVKTVSQYKSQFKNVKDDEIYETFIRPIELDGVMNQVSPRIFEAIATRTVLVLFEGDYSGVVKAGVHFISVKKDGSNLNEVMELLHDGTYSDAIVERAYQDVIASGKYSYQSFVNLVDENIECFLAPLVLDKSDKFDRDYKRQQWDNIASITTTPRRAAIPKQDTYYRKSNSIMSFGKKFYFVCRKKLYYLWSRLPESVRRFLKPLIMKIFKRDY